MNNKIVSETVSMPEGELPPSEYLQRVEDDELTWEAQHRHEARLINQWRAGR
jgi:hypothetical protein